MNLEDIEKKLPNGFHDSILHKLNIDYKNRTVELDLEIWSGDLNSEDKSRREEYKRMRIKLRKFLYFIIEKPDHSYPFFSDQELMIDIGKMSSLKETKYLNDLIQSIPKEAFAYWIFVSQWNSFIYFAALDADYEWI